MLASHPDVYMGRKELHFFGRDLDYHRVPMTLDRYHEHFARRPSGVRRTGDASAWTLFSKSAPTEIADYAADARIVVTLRSPAEMIHSIHGLLVYSTQENIGNFDRAVGCEPERVAGRDIPESARPRMALHYTALGHYHAHLWRWIDVFGWDRICVILLDDLEKDPAMVGAELADFLDLDSQVQAQSNGRQERNAHRVHRSHRIQQWTQRQANRAMSDGVQSFSRRRYIMNGLINRLNGQFAERHPMHKRTRKHINDTLREDIEALGAFLDRDLGHWLAS
jgi:hypothetical protein